MKRANILLLAALGVVAAFTPALLGGTNDKDMLPQFQTSDRCFACHNGMKTQSGKTFDLGLEWQASIMANSSRDPYWQGSVRRETIDHPESKVQIEDECSICHMPVTRYEAKVRGELGTIFSRLPFDPAKKNNAAAEDGITCSVCHQIGPERLGTPESYVGNFVIHPPASKGVHNEYGTYVIEQGPQRIMNSSSGGFQPVAGVHIAESGLCGSCHTLITKSLGEGGKQVGTFYEQMPYPEWLHSDYAGRLSCQSCHMPLINEPTQIASVLGPDRTGARQHTFVGGNFLLAKMLEQYRGELSVASPSEDLQQAVKDSIEFLQTQSAGLVLSGLQVSNGKLHAFVTVQNKTGHKLPTAYPSRRAWLHFVVRDADGNVVFESGKLRADGSIVGNANDDDPTRFEPHYKRIEGNDQVQIYEDIMKDPSGRVTTGLLHAVAYIKDNRILPAGFDKKTAPSEIAVVGEAADDPGFTAGEDRVEYSVGVGNARTPLKVEVELWYQPIGFRWAHNLLPYNAGEPQRFVRYYDSLAASTAVVLAHAEAQK